ncbi:YhdP family protein [Variovorax dokdonensis]|uniref:YhdP family protein n=1 Tax=Variovorax dokdonensis TaxID=344883 RepID=A0ABT7N9N0_9BURK|nr:YhdP family protein [Variovorax dokdonensis]MDM0044656.1 YhdP family protein [Variovorax dokdonensis]
MNVTASPPSRWLSITAVTARWALGLVAAAWIVFALVVVVLHGWIVPRIGEYRGALEAQATRSIGVPVRIGTMSAQAQGWRGAFFPTIELRDVVLLDPQEREALRLPRVVVTVSPRSLWNLGFEHVYVERPELEMRMDAQSRLHVAGLSMPEESARNASGGTRGADWFFSLRDMLIEGGTVRWIDERRKNAPPLLLTDVRFAARNGARSHALALDATPPEGWGQRFSLRGQFRQPVLSTRSGNWQQWDGQVFADLPQIDVSRIGRYVAQDEWRVREGRGALRAWGDVKNGRIVGATLDLGLDGVDATLAPELAPLQLRSVSGRLAYKDVDGVFDLTTTGLSFETEDRLRWPGGDLSLRMEQARGAKAARGRLKAERLDLQMLSQIADRLPLGAALHRQLTARAPAGTVERIEGDWEGPLEAPTRYQMRGRATGLAVAAEAPSHAGEHGQPGVAGATVDFDANQAGGSATIAIAQGALEFPGIFDEPRIPIDSLSARAQWKIEGERLQVQVDNLRFANADAQGEARATWRTSDPATSTSKSRFPGVLDMEGSLGRADGTRVWRYLPLHLGQHVRDYVREAVTAGHARNVTFRVRGDLWDMPFTDPARGEFRIAATVSDVDFDYAPPPASQSARAKGASSAPRWPALADASAELVFERAGMRVNNARGRLAGANGIEVAKGDASIPDMSILDPVLHVNAQAAGPLAEALRVAAPLAGQAQSYLEQVRATGRAEYRLKLEMPLEAMDKSKLQAGVELVDNEVQLSAQMPAFTQARGTLNFTEAGFSMSGLRARLAGGDIRLDGKGRYDGKANDMSFKAQGQLNAEGLRDQQFVPWLSDLGRRMRGSSTYQAEFGWRDGATEFSFASNLQGMALELPAPLVKAADQPLDLRVEKKLLARGSGKGASSPLQDRLSVNLGRIASASWLRDLSGDTPKVINGGILMGSGADEELVIPASGVMARLQIDTFDISAWQALFRKTSDGVSEPPDEKALAYLPNSVALHARELRLAGHSLHNVVLGGSREGTQWRTNVDADELSGYLEYGHAKAGRVMARFARLRIARSEASDVETLLDERAATLPALDVVVNDFELYGRKLGRAEVQAVNQGGPRREWRMSKLLLAMPEGDFNASGIWAIPEGDSAADGRRTTMDFKFDIRDAGALLGRLGMKDVLRRGQGSLGGQVSWRGSPFSLDYPSMDGNLHVDVQKGQFLKAEPGIAKLLGVLSLQALPRRLTLDFRDVFSQGFAFDFIRGDALVAHGVATTNNLQMKGVNAAVLMDGSADIAQETQNLRVVVVPEISAGTAALVATAINPAIGLATFLAQLALSKPLSIAATQEFDIEGTWSDPKITKVQRAPSRSVDASDPASVDRP